MSVVAASLARRRANEKIVNERKAFLKEENNSTSVAKWEERTMNRIAKQDVQNRVKSFTQIEEKTLKQRQQNLFSLYNDDMDKWKVQFCELQNMSAGERLEKLREQALKLRNKREKQRQNFVNECYDRQWRDGCDELRTLYSKAVTEKVMNDRSQFFAIHDLKNNSISSPDVKCKSDNSKEYNHEDTITKTKHAKHQEIKAALDIQMISIRNRNNVERNETMKEAKQKLDQWKGEEELERVKRLQAKKSAQKIGREIQQANAKRKIKREKEVATQREQDLVLLEVALRKEEQDIQLEAKQKDEGKEAAKEHLLFLREQMIHEKKETDNVDAIRQSEMEKTLNKREMLLNIQNEKKRRILTEVNETRNEQIKQKERLLKQEKDELRNQVSMTLLELKHQKQQEREKALKTKEATIQNMIANKKAMKEKSDMKAKEKEDELEFHRNIMHREEELMKRIEKDSKTMIQKRHH